MVQIVKVQIANFRGIQSLEWFPLPGLNCMIGSGDSCKTTVLDAIDWCLGLRRTVNVTDADFHNMDVSAPIQIDITLSDLRDAQLTLEQYGNFLRGYNPTTNGIEDEVGVGLKEALTMRFQSDATLEPSWTLVSDRAIAQGLTKNLTWADRTVISPTRIGVYANHHMSWNKWSVLNKVTEERADASAELALAAREARISFGNSAGARLSGTLETVRATATELGVPVGANVQALLDPHSVSFTGGTIALHDDSGVPLRNLGMGSSRLLVAGLQNKTAERSSIALVDEVETGLEPHRIQRFLRAVGAKDQAPSMQVFMSTHSPSVLRELSSKQLNIVRSGNPHSVIPAGDDNNTQGALRSNAEAFFGTQVLICEGATEVGLIRGIDLYRDDNNIATVGAQGVVCVDGGGVTKLYNKAHPFQRLSYRTGVFRDDDVQPDQAVETSYLQAGVQVFKWSDGKALENELFDCMSDHAVSSLVAYTIGLHGLEMVDANLATIAQQPMTSARILQNLTPENRQILGNAAKSHGWFKRIDYMEHAARTIIGPDIAQFESPFKQTISSIYRWSGL